MKSRHKKESEKQIFRFKQTFPLFNMSYVLTISGVSMDGVSFKSSVRGTLHHDGCEQSDIRAVIRIFEQETGESLAYLPSFDDFIDVNDTLLCKYRCDISFRYLNSTKTLVVFRTPKVTRKAEICMEELNVTMTDLLRYEPTGKRNFFVVRDIRRIHFEENKFDLIFEDIKRCIDSFRNEIKSNTNQDENFMNLSIGDIVNTNDLPSLNYLLNF